MLLLDEIALWLSGIALTAMTVFAGIGVRSDEMIEMPPAERWAGRLIFLSLAVLSLFVLTAAVLK